MFSQNSLLTLCDSDHSLITLWLSWQVRSHLNINPSILPNSTPATAFFAPSVRAEDLRFFTFKNIFSHLTAHCQGFLTRYPTIIQNSSHLKDPSLNPEIRSNIRVVSVDSLYWRWWCFIVTGEDHNHAIMLLVHVVPVQWQQVMLGLVVLDNSYVLSVVPQSVSLAIDLIVSTPGRAARAEISWQWAGATPGQTTPRPPCAENRDGYHLSLSLSL